MITERMTAVEIDRELVADIPGILNYRQKLDSKFRRIVIKATKFPVCVHTLYTSKRRNNWIIILRAYSKKDIGPLCKCIYASYYNTDHGYYAAALNEKGTTIYTPHFFSRYAERNKIGLHGVNLMIHYFRNNVNLAGITQEVELPDGSRQILVECSTEEGICLGLMQADHIILMKTFITREMAKGEQVKNFIMYELLRKVNFNNNSK